MAIGPGQKPRHGERSSNYNHVSYEEKQHFGFEWTIRTLTLELKARANLLLVN